MMLSTAPNDLYQQLVQLLRRAPLPQFRVGSVPVYGDLILAPMDGYSDLPFRLLCRELGSAMSYTEFVNVDSFKGAKTGRIPLMKLEYDPSERPMTFQIYGFDESRIVETAKQLQDLGPNIIDINMGCYVRDIAERGAGSGMLRDLKKIARLFGRLCRELSVPVTAKIRLGWDDQTRNHVTVAKTLEENGASLVAVHGRTKMQGYTGRADWDAIAEVKQAVEIPVLANGDVRTVADIDRIKAQTGCDGVMIGRAAIGNPWIFARKDKSQVSLEERIALVRRHLALNLDFYGPRTGLVLFRKHAVRYIQGFPGSAALRALIVTCTDRDEFERLIERARPEFQI
jgi:tRNA-dihydrouridine synthase B